MKFIGWEGKKKGSMDSQQSESPASQFPALQIESQVTTPNRRGQAPPRCKGCELPMAPPHSPSARAVGGSPEIPLYLAVSL